MLRAFGDDVSKLVHDATAAGVATIYAVDDDFSALDPETPLGRRYRDLDAWNRILELCRTCRNVWTFSRMLADKLASTNPRIVVLPAMASIERIDGLRAAAGVPDEPAKVIGYAGQPTHFPDLASIAGPIESVLEAHPDWSVEVVNVDPGDLARHPRVRHFPAFQNVESYYRFMVDRNWAIGLAPLVPGPGNAAKTDNKYREFGSLRIAGVYSPVPPYFGSVAQGITGFFASTADEWTASTSMLIDDPQLRARIVQCAHQDVAARYSIARIATRYFDCIQSAVHRPRRVLIVAPKDNASVDIDVMRPFQTLGAEGCVDWTVSEQLDVTDADMEGKDCMIVVRYTDPHTLQLIQRAREKHGIPTVYSWDDDYFAIPAELGDVAEYYRAEVTINSLRGILAAAALVKASTPRLAERSREYAKHVVVSPFGFDFQQLMGSGRAVGGDDLVIGFFGSRMHGSNLTLLMPALSRIAAEFPHVRFEFFGPDIDHPELPPRLTQVSWNPSATESLNTLRNRGWAIGLAPLEINDFNRAKLPTKYRDYAACGIPGIYSDIDPYSDNVANGETGLLVAPEPDAWHDAIATLIANPVLRRRIAANAYLHVRTSISLDQSILAWRNLLDELCPAPEGWGRPLAGAPLADAAAALGGDARIAILEKRVRLLQASARMLLEQKQMLEGGKLGRLRRIVQKIKGSTDLSRDRSPAFAHFRPKLGDPEAHEVRLELSANLQERRHIEYPVPELPRDADYVEVALAVPVPTLPGTLTVEIIAGDEVRFSRSMPIGDIDPFEPVRVALDGRAPDVPTRCKIRFLESGSLSPVFVYQLREVRNDRVRPFLAFGRNPPA